MNDQRQDDEPIEIDENGVAQNNTDNEDGVMEISEDDLDTANNSDTIEMTDEDLGEEMEVYEDDNVALNDDESTAGFPDTDDENNQTS